MILYLNDRFHCFLEKRKNCVLDAQLLFLDVVILIQNESGSLTIESGMPTRINKCLEPLRLCKREIPPSCFVYFQDL